MPRSRHRRTDRAALGVRPQELFLPGSAEGLPDQPIRAADRGGGHARDRARRRCAQAHRHHACPPRGGRRQVAARGLTGTHRHRSQPRGHSAHRDRQRAGHAFRTRSHRLHEKGAHLGALPRHLRRQHAGRFFPLRCQRLSAAAGRRAVRYPCRDQESQLLPFRRESHQLRGRAPDRADRIRRQGGAGDAALRP